MAEILYTSSDVHTAIKRLFIKPSAHDRRVAVVAYVGRGASAFLPSPAGLRLICNPTPGATSPDALRELTERGAQVEFAAALHMKVYWSEQRGCVIASANLSSNALGGASLYEAGVCFPRGHVDIDRLIKDIRPVPVTELAMSELDRAADQEAVNPRGRGAGHYLSTSFAEWLASPYRRSWKIAWWHESEVEYAAEAKARAKSEYGRDEPTYIMNVAKNQVGPADWLLCFNSWEGKISAIEWMYVDYVVHVRASEKGTFEKDYPFQAAQVHPLSRYPRPPFKLDASFRKAFSKAVKAFGVARIESTTSLRLPKDLLREIVDAHGLPQAAV